MKKAKKLENFKILKLIDLLTETRGSTFFQICMLLIQ
jgi:hypothetical protein